MSYFYRFVTGVRHTCPSCSARIKKNVLWEVVGNILLCLPVVVCVIAFQEKMISFALLAIVILLTLIAGTVLFPYCTKIDLAESNDSSTQPNAAPLPPDPQPGHSDGER